MIRLIDAQEDLEEFIALVREYTDAILQQDAAVAKTLASQHLEDELKDIEEKYSFPDGRMYILLVDGRAAGYIEKYNDNPAENAIFMELKL